MHSSKHFKYSPQKNNLITTNNIILWGDLGLAQHFYIFFCDLDSALRPKTNRLEPPSTSTDDFFYVTKSSVHIKFKHTCLYTVCVYTYIYKIIYIYKRSLVHWVRNSSGRSTGSVRKGTQEGTDQRNEKTQTFISSSQPICMFFLSKDLSGG